MGAHLSFLRVPHHGCTQPELLSPNTPMYSTSDSNITGLSGSFLSCGLFDFSISTTFFPLLPYFLMQIQALTVAWKLVLKYDIWTQWKSQISAMFSCGCLGSYILHMQMGTCVCTQIEHLSVLHVQILWDYNLGLISFWKLLIQKGVQGNQFQATY